jgi:hypothetical protein
MASRCERASDHPAASLLLLLHHLVILELTLPDSVFLRNIGFIERIISVGLNSPNILRASKIVDSKFYRFLKMLTI